MKGVDEVHLLNITVAPAFQRQGWAPLMLEALTRLVRRPGRPVAAGSRCARATGARSTSTCARAIARVGVRKGYYPAPRASARTRSS